MKKISPNWSVALTYYILSNLIAFIPLIAVNILVERIASTIWQYLLLNAATLVPVVTLSLKLSAKNINKNFAFLEKRPIVNLTIGYLLFFNGAFILIIFLSVGYVSGSLLASIINIILVAITVSVFTPKFIKESPAEEVEQIKKEMVANPKSNESVGKQIISTVVFTILGFLLLLVVPFILYFIITDTLKIQTVGAFIILSLWEVMIILLAKRFAFKKNEANPDFHKIRKDEAIFRIIKKVFDRVLMLIKYINSFSKKNWNLYDYPIRIKHFKDTKNIDLTGRFKPVIWEAQVIGWFLSGCGDTREEALNNLEKNFSNYKKEHVLPRPGTDKPIEFAPTVEIEQYKELLEEFCIKILGFKSMEGIFISDESSLWDFHMEDSNEKYVNKIKEVYGVDTTRLGKSGNILSLLKLIREKQTRD